MRFRNLIGMGVIAMVLFGCSGPSVESYEGVSPTFDVRKYFSGRHEGYGMLRNWSGKVTRRFHFTMQGDFTEEGGTLNESFTFDDGEKQKRTWKFTMKDANHFTGTASDGVGTAEGKQFGNVIQMRYTLKVNVDGKDMNIDFDDWLFLQTDNKGVINETKMKKFGIPVGRLSIFIEKKS